MRNQPFDPSLIEPIADLIAEHSWLIWIPIALIAYGMLTQLIATRHRRDPQRLFDARQKRQLRARAGNRCEHKHPFWFRCRARAEHADHVVPWSKGGRTDVANGQMLCAPHNLSKFDIMPSHFYRWRLKMRRRRYRNTRPIRTSRR